MTRKTDFWPHVEISATCWLWTGTRHNSGYGRCGNDLAHRVSWRHFHGPIPRGLYVCHHCDNPVCVRPDHLFLGTAADNNRDARQKGRSARGETHGRHRLTATEVEAMRYDRAAGARLRVVAEKFGVSEAEASLIARGLKWPDAPGPLMAKDPRWKDGDA